jgi:hypothetical protein
MTEETVSQFGAVVIGGLIAITSGFVTTVLEDRQRRARLPRNLAMAFKGEIAALVDRARERRYADRISEVIAQIEATNEPFFMPLRIRFAYDRVFDNNVEQIGILGGPLPELIPRFYTGLTLVLYDMANLADGTSKGLPIPVLLRVYRDAQRVLGETLAVGERVIEEIDVRYR